ncbi:MAG TPA: trypsin-like peptidase domain-containing protein [Blastocatellia bacterium]|nr:trypsin-like peptidase domain-containing protein [Blastocatellia bacterium]
MKITFTHQIGPRKGEVDKFEADTVRVGRASDNLLAFSAGERRVSAHHAEIKRKGNHYILQDLGSTNGTMINGRRVITTELKSGDLIEFGAGGPLVRFGLEDDSDSEPTVRLHREKHAKGQDEFVHPSTVERIVDRAVRTRASNLRLIVAIAAAMAIGAAVGIALSSRRDPGYTSWAAVAERNQSAVVFIRTEFELVDGSNQVLDSGARTGSGFVLSSSGLIVTNRHLVRDWDYNPPPAGITGRIKNIEVIFPGKRREEAIQATLHRLSASTTIDVAVLKIEPPEGMPTVSGLQPDLEFVNQGDDVAVIGYPLGMDLLQLTNETRITTSLSIGVVSRVSREMIQLNLRAYRGNSGGPVLNRSGEVIGILTANVGAAQDLALATPIGAALELIKDEVGY